MINHRSNFTGGWRSKILMWVILIVASLLGLAACSNSDQGAISRRDHAADMQTEFAKRTAREIELVITSRAYDLQLIGQVSGFGNLTGQEQRSVFSKMLTFDDMFDELILLDSNGQEVVREARQKIITDSDLQDRSAEPEFTVPAETRETYFGAVTLDPLSGDPLMIISVPLIDLRTGEVSYVLVGQFRFRVVWELFQAQELYPNQDVYLVDSNSVVVAHRDSSVVLQNTQFETRDRDKITTGLNGEEVVIGLASFTVGAQEFTVVAELATSGTDR